MSTIAEIAEAVKDAINAAATSQFVVEAQRVYLPLRDYKGVSEHSPTVLVFPRVSERTAETRRSFRNDIEIHVWYAQKVTQLEQPNNEDANEVIDQLMDFVEQLAEVITPKQEYAGVPCLRIEHDPIYDYDVLYSHRVLVGVVKCFFMRSTDL